MDARLLAATRDERWGAATAVVGTALLTAAFAPFQSRFGLLNVGLAFLLLTVLISATWGWRVGLFAAALTNVTLNFFFVPPLHTLTVRHPEHIVGLAVFLVVSVVTGSLLSRAQASARAARRRQAETAVLLELSRELIGSADPRDALAALCDVAVRAMEARAASVLSLSDRGWNVLASSGNELAKRAPDRSEGQMAEQAVASGRLTWLGHTGLHPRRRRWVVHTGPGRGLVEVSHGVAFVPLRIGERPLGVLRLDGPIGDTAFREHPEELLNAFAREAALAVQRVELAYEAAHAEALRQADELKDALMASVSHDLKTPLAGIKAAVSSLLDHSVAWSPEDTQSFLDTIDSQADRLDRVISDILDLTRIEAGVIRPVRRAVGARQLLEDALERTRTVTAGRRVAVDAPESLLVEADASLVLQALVNLIENATKYSVPGSAISLAAAGTAAGVELIVADEGPGIAAQDLPHVFERFYRAADQSQRVKGSGLGLAIVKGFVVLSGGTIRVESSPRGTRFVIALPAAVGAGAA